MTRSPIRRVVRLLAWAVPALLLVLIAGLFAARSEWGRARIVRLIVTQAVPYIDGELQIGRIDGGLFGDATLRDVRIVRDGVVILRAAEVLARYRLRDLFSSAIVLDDVRLTGPEVTVTEMPTGWRVEGIRLPKTKPGGGPPPTFFMPSVEVRDGRLTVRPVGQEYDLVRLSASGDVAVTTTVIVNITRMQAHEAIGNLPLTSVTTRVVVTDRVTLSPLAVTTPHSELRGTMVWTPESTLEASFESAGFSLPEFAPYVPAIEGMGLRPSFTLTLSGPLDALHVVGPVRDPVAGNAVLDLVANVTGTFAARGTAEMTGLDAAPVFLKPEWPTRLHGRAEFNVRDDGTGATVGTFAVNLTGSTYQDYRITRGRATGTLTAAGGFANFVGEAYGAASTGTMRWELASDTTWVTGRVRGLDMARLPAFLELPAFDTDLAGAYAVRMTGERWTLDSTLDASTLEGAAIAAGTLASMSIDGDDVVYSVKGHLRDFDPKRVAPKLLEAPVEWPITSARVSGDITVEGAGAMSALADHRVTFSGLLDADVDGARVRQARVSGALAARRLAAEVDAGITGAWETVGGLKDLTVRPDGRVRASVRVPDITAAVGPTFADGAIDLALARLQISDLELTSATLVGTATDGVVTITRGEAAGPLGRMQVTGTLALAETASSDLTYRLDVADLTRLPAAFGIEASGQGHVEGRLTGPRSAATLQGSWSGSSLAMSDITALYAAGRYDVQVPDLDATRTAGYVEGEATFLAGGGQEWPRVTGRATLEAGRMSLTTELEHARGVATVAGNLATLPDDVWEFTASALLLRLSGQEWRLVEGAAPVARMSADRFSISRTELGRGDERVVIEGAMPFAGAGVAPEEGMRITATDVSVASLMTTLLGAERVTGRLDGTVTVAGSVEAPRVQSTFMVTEGTADGVPFTSMGGDVSLSDRTASVNLRLDAAARGQAAVKGVVPVAADAPGLDLTVTAALTDLGVVAPALPYVTNAAGAATADLRITGSQASPLVNGTVGLDDVRFDVPETGVSYRRMNVGVRITESVMAVDRSSVEDADGHVLRVSGTLDALRRDRPGDVDLRIVADQFRLLGNQFGELVVNLNLIGAGTLAAPQMLGTITVQRGRFEVDRLLRQFTPVYAYTPAAPPDRPAAPVPPTVFSGAAFSIDLILPDNVIVRGRGLQTEDGPIGLGDINLTLGGTLQVMKARGQQPSLVGEVNAVRGTYEFQGRRFAIQRGSRLRFRGDDYTNPTLDINAEREVSGVTVRARIQGTAAEPSLVLSSNPVLEESDILALVVFNRPINQLGEAQKISLAARAGSLAAGAVAGPLAASVARALDLDVFDIQTNAVGTTGPVVTVGRQVSDRLFVGFRHEFGAQGANRLTFEYRLTEFLRILTSFAPGAQPANRSARTEAAGIDLIFVIRR